MPDGSLFRRQEGRVRAPWRAPINPLFGLVHGARNDGLKFFTEMGAHREVVDFPNPFGRFYLVNDPNLIHRVLEGNYRNYPKSDFYQRVRPIFGAGLFELEGDEWKHKRQVIQPAFHRQQIEAMATLMVDEIAELIDTWEQQPGRRLDVCPPLMQMTFRVITRCISNADIPGDMDELTDALTLIMREGERVLWALVPQLHSLPGPRRTRLKKALATFDACMYALIQDRIRSGKQHGDLLDLLLAQTDPDTGEMVSPQVLRDDLMTILIAGHETTAMAIAWSCAMISKHPDIRDKLKAEVDTVLGDRRPVLADLKELRYTGMVVEEALRLYPPFWSISRKAEQDDMLGDYHIAAGSTLMLCPYVTHRNPVYWRDPERFDPERFSPEQSEGRPKYAYFPFGGGPRVCLGKAFALMEAKLYLAMMVQKFALDLVPGQRLGAEPMISLRPLEGLEMEIRSIR